jgi:hypothetical protein
MFSKFFYVLKSFLENLAPRNGFTKNIFMKVPRRMSGDNFTAAVYSKRLSCTSELFLMNRFEELNARVRENFTQLFHRAHFFVVRIGDSDPRKTTRA